MLANLGNVSLVLALMFSIYASIALATGMTINNQNLVQSGRRSLMVVFGLTFVVYSILTLAFIANDFNISFVFQNSSTDLPLFYKITGPWGGLEGSLVLWALILTASAVMVSVKYYRKFPALVAYSLLVLAMIEIFILLILVFLSNPLSGNLPPPAEGQGLNPLLQNPGMIAHPPLLYLGFVGLSVPFAFACSSLLLGQMNNDWILVTRRWSLAAWLFLTAGMLVGGMWAYHVLGWGGYWAWDPVENSSLLPWLAVTTFLHSSLAQEKTKSLRIWNVALIIIAFTLTLVGTFITRSGILNSVHAFSESNLGPVFLGFIVVVLISSFGLLIYRAALQKENFVVSGFFNKENLFLVNNLLFLTIIFSVLYGTIYPLISEALTGRLISIQAPFFNKVNYPLLIILLLLMAIAPLAAWRRANYSYLLGKTKYPFLGALLVGIAGYFFILADFRLFILIFAIYFSLHLTIFNIYENISNHKLKFNLRQNNNNKNTDHKTIPFLKNRRRLGGMVVHLGIVLTFIGVGGNFFSYDQNLTLGIGESANIGQYKIVYEGLDSWNEFNVRHEAAVIQVWKNDGYIKSLTPSKAFYPTSGEPMTIVDIHRTLLEDLYLSLVAVNNGETVTLTVYLNRLVLFIPLSLVFFVLGVLLCFDRRKAGY